MASTMIPEYFLSERGCERTFDLCYGGHEDAVKMNRQTARWYITMGHPGFNSPANNGRGYRTYATAYAAMEKYGKRS